jgi:LuxR family maltose regulon positive regulatory protein
VISIAAPAGYGKTTLLAQWAAEDPRPFAWVSLDGRDDDPAAFLTYLTAAADEITPVDAGVFRGADRAPIRWDRGLPRLGAALAAIGKPMVLVLDDVHELRDRDCIDALEPIAKHLPDGAQLVLSGRAEERLPLARLRAAGRLLALGTAELALSDSEAKGLLTEAGVKVSAAEASSLNERTEGWVAGLYLAALFSQEAGSADLTRFSGDDRFVADYLRSEHLSRLKPSVLQFLTRTSVVDRMCASLCDALLDRSDSARRLGALEEANLFLVPLDHRREWYRYRHLFRDTLRAELDRLAPEAGEGLRRRAAGWYEQNGQPEAAIAHMAAAGDMDEVAAWSAVRLPYYRSRRVVTVERWLKRLGVTPQPLPGSCRLRRVPAQARPPDDVKPLFALEHPAGRDVGRELAQDRAFRPCVLCRHGIAGMSRCAPRLGDLPAPALAPDRSCVPWHLAALRGQPGEGRAGLRTDGGGGRRQRGDLPGRDRAL